MSAFLAGVWLLGYGIYCIQVPAEGTRTVVSMLCIDRYETQFKHVIVYTSELIPFLLEVDRLLMAIDDTPPKKYLRRRKIRNRPIAGGDLEMLMQS